MLPPHPQTGRDQLAIRERGAAGARVPPRAAPEGESAFRGPPPAVSHSSEGHIIWEQAKLETSYNRRRTLVLEHAPPS